MRAEPFATRSPADELAALVQRSRRLGANPELVVHGGGNTSSKIEIVDRLGRPRTALWIKASGADLATIDTAGFVGLYLDELLPLRDRASMSDEELVDWVLASTIAPSGRRPSIETLLHAFLPARHVDHVHADAVCALTAQADPERAVADALGDDVGVVPYVRPGFALARQVADLADRRAVVLSRHGLVTWGEEHEESTELVAELVERARAYLARRTRPRPAPPVPTLGSAELGQLLPRLRGRLSAGGRVVLHVDRSQRPLADRPDAARVAADGRATPDHLLRIGRASIVAGPDDVDAAVDAFEADSELDRERHRALLAPGLAARPAQPRVALVPGLGCVAAGGSAEEARANAEVAGHSHAVMAQTLDAFGAVEWLDEADRFDFEHWPLELHKLTLAPPAPELAARVVVVTGAASGIGRATALELARLGAHLVLADLDPDGLDATAAEVPPERVAAVAGDLTDEEVVDRVALTAVERYGGLDAVVSNAGFAASAPLAELSPSAWERSLAVNTTSHFLLTRRVWPILERQGLGGSLVYVASKNAFGPGARFGAYSVAKAAEVQLARIAAIEGGPLGIRANTVNPDAIFEGSRLWSEELRAERAAAHGVPVEGLEDFYAERNLLGRRVTARDVAESVAFLVSDRSRSTTGCVLTVDGGVAAAFPR